MTEHVEAGMAFYKQGKLDMVAPHLLHPVSKTHSLECVGLEKFDFNSAIFLEVSTEIKSLLRLANDNPYEVALKSLYPLMSCYQKQWLYLGQLSN